MTVALILAGNTPLMAWSPLCACLLAGVERVRVKMSTAETLWPTLFVEALAEVDPGTAGRIELNVWPGEDARTGDLIQTANALIAYGSDSTLSALRAQTPPGIPFYGFGHAVSLGLIMHEDAMGASGWKAMRGFATDALMYGQQGCLSPHILYGEHFRMVDIRWAALTLERVIGEVADALEVPAVTDPTVANAVRNARDMALFAGHEVKGDDRLRWTIITTRTPIPYPEPVGQGVIYLSPLGGGTIEELRGRLEPVRGKVSAVAISWEASGIWREALLREGISRIAKPGEMQTPPLDWPNGNIDLLAELLRITAAATGD